MNVYVVSCYVVEEPEAVLIVGVYDSKDKAEKAMKDFEENSQLSFINLQIQERRVY